MSKRSISVVAAILLAVVVVVFVVFENNNVDGLRADPTNPQQVARGEAVYAKACATCHGANLQGEANWRSPRRDGRLPAPPHDASGHTWHHPDQLLFEITKFGGRRFNPSSSMPGFGSVFSDDDLWATLAFIKSRWPAQVRQRQRETTLASDR